MRKGMKPGTRRLLSIALAWLFILAGSAGIVTTGYFPQVARSASMMAASAPAGAGHATLAEDRRSAPPTGDGSAGAPRRLEGRPQGAEPTRDGGSGLVAASLAKVAGYAGILAGLAWLTAVTAGLARKRRMTCRGTARA